MKRNKWYMSLAEYRKVTGDSRRHKNFGNRHRNTEIMGLIDE